MSDDRDFGFTRSLRATRITAVLDPWNLPKIERHLGFDENLRLCAGVALKAGWETIAQVWIERAVSARVRRVLERCGVGDL
jgi:hypothetical protein